MIKQISGRKISDKPIIFIILVMIVAELLCTAMHKTMGGSQFGNRYPNDVLPLVLLGLAMLLPKEKGKYEALNIPLFMIGLCLNIVGAVGYYNGYFN